MQEFAALPAEAADGYAQQVTDTWRMIRESQRDEPSFTGRPVVVRGVAVLPVPPSKGPHAGTYEVDFLPHVSKTKADARERVRRAYDARFLIKGNENVGANYVKLDGFDSPQPIYADADGQRAPLTVRRGTAVSDQLPASLDDAGVTPRSQGAIALYMAPHVIKDRAPAPTYEAPATRDSATFGGFRGPGLGAAEVSVGAGSWISSTKSAEGLIDRVAPELLGRPIIYSLQLLTFER